VTALWGAVMCYTQRHLKRLLAFSTISHIGVFVCGIGLLSDHGLAGAAIWVLGHGLTKAALFMLVGVLLHRFGTVDEFALHGRGAQIPVAGLLFGTGGLLLSALPGVTAFFGKSLLESAALKAHDPWLPAVVVLSSMLTGGAVLRVTGRVFMGWGTSKREEDVVSARPASEESDEEVIARNYTPPLMLVVPAVLLAASIVLGLIPGLVPGIETAAAHFQDHASYARWVLQGVAPDFAPVTHAHVETFDYLYAAAGTLGALAIAGLTLFAPTLHRRLPQTISGPLRSSLKVLRELHSGHIGDYIAWWTTAAALLGGASLILL
jgi:multicomponent Na+:H+ antiporter subunit D